MSITELPVKSLVKVLSDLRGGTIGFDPYRDARTRSKPLLLSFIVSNHDNASIIAAMNKLQASESESTTVVPTVTHNNDAAETFRTINVTHKTTETDEQIAKRLITPMSMPSVVQEPKPVQSKQQPGTEAQQIAALLESLASKASPAVDLATVKRVVQEAVEDDNEKIRQLIINAENLLDYKISKFQAPTIVHTHNVVTSEIKDLGAQHRNFPMLLKACQASDSSGHRLNIWLHGPAGAGKTHAAHKVAEALSLPFQSNGTLLTEHSLSGFVDAHGTYHGSAFRTVFEHGGVYLGDEYDVWNPKAAMWLQAALANGYTRFPDGMVKRHADCVIIFGANTVGKGATNDYSTRAKVDDANLNRLVFIDWPLDETLELAISPNPQWTKIVQATRAKIEARKLKGHMITPRQSIQGAALLDAGLTMKQVTDMVLRRGLSDDQWNEIKPEQTRAKKEDGTDDLSF